MRTLIVPVLALSLVSAALAGKSNPPTLPRFTEEREAAALFFVKKHVPEVVPLLEHLKKNNPTQYQQEIREIFQETEYLADLQDDPRRHDLELKIWQTESRVYALVAKLATANEEDRKKTETSIHDLARELVALDVQVLQLKADRLDKEATEVKDELAKARDQADRQTQTRYEALLEEAKKRKKT